MPPEKQAESIYSILTPVRGGSPPCDAVQFPAPEGSPLDVEARSQDHPRSRRPALPFEGGRLAVRGHRGFRRGHDVVLSLRQAPPARAAEDAQAARPCAVRLRALLQGSRRRPGRLTRPACGRAAADPRNARLRARVSFLRDLPLPASPPAMCPAAPRCTMVEPIPA